MQEEKESRVGRWFLVLERERERKAERDEARHDERDCCSLWIIGESLVARSDAFFSTIWSIGQLICRLQYLLWKSRDRRPLVLSGYERQQQGSRLSRKNVVLRGWDAPLRPREQLRRVKLRWNFPA